MPKKPAYEELEQRIQELEQSESELKTAEKALRESEDRYKNFFDNALAGLFRSRLSDGMFIEMNSKAAEQLGLSVEEVVGKVHATDLYRNSDQRRELISKLKQDGEVHGFETDLKLLDGRDVTLSISVKAYPDNDYMEGAVIDITERKQAESDFIKSEARYKQIFENIQDVYYETSIDGTILEISPSIENISQYNRNELVGRSLYDFYTSSEERDELLKLILDKGKVSNFEVSLTDKDGSKRFCSISSLLVRDEQDDPIKLVGTMRDVTEKKQAENERKLLEAQLLQAQKMEAIGNLAGGIAHDFNNILTSIIGFTELSLDEVEKGTHLEDNLQEVYTAGKRAKDLVSQILAFARQSGEELKPIQVDMVAAEALKFIRSSIPTTIEIKQNIESDSLIMGNATQVHQILMNLFTNAAYAMEDKGGILGFSLKDVVMDRGVAREKLSLNPGNYIEIKVSDTGTGIGPEIIGAIFDPYFTTKGPGEGTGMGLAVVHGIVKSYGGKISVDSKPGHGTLFRIYLPVTRKRQKHRPYQSETLPTGTERILFVDDEAPIAKMGGQTLEGLGYTVSIRTSSIEALELFRSKPNDFDLVITDMTMPNMTGDKLAVELMKIR
ncbi:MAG: PAS domain S-box protein, partial [Desulfobacterales bacterium]